MSEADKMFEEIGYKKVKEDNNFIVYKCKERVKTIEISFWKTYKYFQRTVDSTYITWVDMQELKAINKKCQEMGWL